MGLHHKVEVPTMIATKPIVKHSGPGAYRPRTPSLYAFDEDGSYGLDATPYPYGDDDRSYGSLEASGPADPWTQTDPALPRRGPQQKVVRRGGALPLGAITVDVRKGGRRGDARRARARDCAGGLPDICTSWPAVVRADVLRGAAEHVLGDVVRGPVAAPDEVATKANASHVAVGLPDGQRREPGRQRRPPRHGPPHHDRRPGGPDIYPRVGRAGGDGRVPAPCRGGLGRRAADARGGPSAQQAGVPPDRYEDKSTRAFTPHRRQGGHWKEGAPVQHCVDIHCRDAARLNRRVASTPSTRRLLDGVAMPVHRSTGPTRHRHRREMTW